MNFSLLKPQYRIPVLYVDRKLTKATSEMESNEEIEQEMEVNAYNLKNNGSNKLKMIEVKSMLRKDITSKEIFEVNKFESKFKSKESKRDFKEI